MPTNTELLLNGRARGRAGDVACATGRASMGFDENMPSLAWPLPV